MAKSIIISFLFLCVVGSLATDCNPLDNLDGYFNPTCSNADTPYCTQAPGATTASCVSCVSNCDCDMDQFCSEDPNHWGTCTEFSREGNDCRSLTQKQITNSTFPDSWKCAITFENAQGQLMIDQQGACIEGTCKYCDFRGNGGMPGCGTTSGLKAPRTCVYPGYLTTPHTAPWTPGVYYETPENVWWAVFFCFLIILLAVHTITCLATIRQHRH